MKTKLSTLIGVITILMISFLIIPGVTSFTTGPSGGAAGSPGDNNLTCVQCHASNNNFQNGWVVGNELETDGYQVNQAYTVYVKGYKNGTSKFGFQATCEDVNGDKQGTPTSSSNPNVQVVATWYPTHTAAGTAQTDSASWGYSWQAPSSNRGILTFYAAILAANGNSQNTGDVVYVSEMITFPYGTQGVANESENGNQYYLYPNPASTFFSVDLAKPDTDGKLTIFALNGTIVKEITWSKIDRVKVDVSDIAVGNYLVRMVTSNDSFTGKLIISR
jgi:hypothetical protein